MTTIRVLFAALGLMGVTWAWYTNHVPALIAVPAAAALVIWGFNLDWRRKKRLADAKAETKERDDRLAEQQENRS